jgi:hypothetical protein
MRASAPFARTAIAEDTIKKLIDGAVRRGIIIVSFTGGEPFLVLPLLVRLINYAAEAGIRYVRTGTNGFFLRHPDESGFARRVSMVAGALAATRLRNFWISIDSCDASAHERMRGFPGVIKGIERALPVFHAAGLYPAANVGINRNMAGGDAGALLDGCGNAPPKEMRQCAEAAANKVFSFVQTMGFTSVNACYPMSAAAGDAVYGATSPDRIVSFTKQEKAWLFAGLSDAVAAHRSRIRIFTPRSSLYALGRAQTEPDFRPYPCRGGIDFFFASAHGRVYPCGYRGNEPLGETWGKNGKGSRGPACYKCEWECFRDPSELFGPIADLVSAPWRLAQRFLKDPTFVKLWINDMRYFAACGFHNGRVAPDQGALSRFAPGENSRTAKPPAHIKPQPRCLPSA